MILETELIVLKAIRYSDNNSIVHAYSKELGSVAFKISRSPRKKKSGERAFFIPLSILRVELDYFPKREVQVPKEVALLHVPARPSSDAVANAIAFLLTEVLSRVLRVGHSDTKLYEYLKEQILLLEEVSKQELPSLHLQTLVGICFYLGVLPNTDEYQPGYILRPEEGGFSAPRSELEQSAGATSALLVSFIQSPTPLLIPLNRGQRNNLLRLLLDYLSFHYPNLHHMQSPEVLSQLW